MTNQNLASEQPDLSQVVLDPTLGRFRRRYFSQPAQGRGRRSFTAARAARPSRTGPAARRLGAVRQWWQAARYDETLRRRGYGWV